MRLLLLVEGLLVVARDLSCVNYPVLLVNDYGSCHGLGSITSIISARIHVGHLH